MEIRILKENEKALYRSDIIEMLRESDKDFVPPLSARASTLDTTFGGNTTYGGVLSYYEKMNEQMILAAFEDGELLAFVSYRENFISEIIDEDTLPNIYVSTLVMRHSARGRGLTAIMYDHLFDKCYPRHSIYTRTWSTNGAHTKILSRFGFSELKRIKNDRGEGIDTVYYAREAGSPLTV